MVGVGKEEICWYCHTNRKRRPKESYFHFNPIPPDQHALTVS